MKKLAYIAPEIKTVEFKVEVGLALSNVVDPTPTMELTGTNYESDNNWHASQYF